MLVIAFIAFGYASTLPRGPQSPEYLRMFGYDPSWYGISVIFMMTGWLAMRSLDRHGSALKFLASRIGRNLPLLAVFAAMVPLVFFPLFGVSPEPGTSRLNQHLSYFAKVVSCVDPSTLTPGLLDNALYMCLIQGGLWTFRWGLVAFLATALLWATGILKNRYLLLTMTIVALAMYGAAVLYNIRYNSEMIGFATPGLKLGWAYLVGASAFAFREKLGRALLVPAGLFAATLLQYLLLPWTPGIEITATLALGYLAYFGMTSTREMPVGIKRIPDISLGLYVFNWPMAQIILLTIPGLSPLGLFAVSFPLTVLLSLTLWAVINNRTNRRLDQITGLSTA
jgi:peptidoglycan/LPS O-acetylase OafA/YrhL